MIMSLNKCECGAMVSRKITNCPNCGNLLNPSVISASTIEIINQSSTDTDSLNKSKVKDKKSLGINILSVLFPIVGYIVYFVWRKETPIRAKSILTSALIGSAIGILFTFIGG